MKTVTYEEFLKFDPCWLKNPEKARKLEEIGRRKERWTALDVLNLPEEEVSDEDKLWAVTRPEFMEEMDLHEFGCWCAEDALSRVENPDPRSLAAIEAKRKWMRGEIGDEELEEARDNAWDAADAAAWASDSAARAAAWASDSAAWVAARAASAAARAADSAARAAAWDARAAAWDARAVDSAARAAAWAAARAHQVAKLRELLDEKSIPGEKGESHHEAV